MKNGSSEHKTVKQHERETGWAGGGGAGWTVLFFLPHFYGNNMSFPSLL